MKGLLLSLALLVAYILSSAILAHILKIKRHSDLFIPLFIAWSPIYFAAYFWTPRHLYILPSTWTSHTVSLDVLYGYVVFFLNCHSFVDIFFATCGGFSASIMRAMLSAGRDGIATEELISKFKTAEGSDKIYGWRVPHLAKRGYILVDPGSGECRLTLKGRLIARSVVVLKRLMNLGKGG